MEKKQSKPKTKTMKFLPRPASAVNFHSPIGPGKENHPVAGRVFSDPIKISIIPQQARPKPTKSGFATPEPVSPKVSCIGQIKKKKKMKGLAKSTAMATTAAEIPEPKKRHPAASLMKRILTGGKMTGRVKSKVAAAVGLNEMKGLSSGRRGVLANFDWKAQVSPVWIDEELGPLQPRKEVNLWMRRTFLPPTPLQL